MGEDSPCCNTSQASIVGKMLKSVRIENVDNGYILVINSYQKKVYNTLDLVIEEIKNLYQ